MLMELSESLMKYLKSCKYKILIRMKKILVVCAHPDDETLGMGGTIALHTQKNENVFVLIVSEGESARGEKISKIAQRKKQSENACKLLGVKKIKFLDYEDQKLDTVPLSELSQKIETVIKDWKPNVVYTHFWNDINQDHRQVYEATSIAVRPLPKSKISQFIVFETPSSTEWGSKKKSFSPNLFIDVTKVIKKKLQAFTKYKNEVMPYPHPRSKKSVINRARFWGNSVGLEFAESFMIVRDIR